MRTRRGDTDAVVQALPHGIETFLLLRSADSPEDAVYEARGDGVTLRAAVGDPSRIEIVRGDEAIGYVERPAAWDAEGEPVPIAWEVRDGNRLALRFPHRGRDFAYPIAVDPVITDGYMENFNLDSSGNQANRTYGSYWNDPFVGWAFTENRANYFPHYISTDDATRGLTVYGYQGVFYYDNDYGEWYWQAPRQAFIERADFGYVTTTDRYRTCTVEGICSPSRYDWEYGTWYEADGTTGPSPTLRSGAAART
jgi:hypothetical protein